MSLDLEPIRIQDGIGYTASDDERDQAETALAELVAEVERLRTANEELAQAVRLADQEADEVIAELNQKLAVLTAKLESAERMRETSRLRSERLEAEVERLRADLRIADEATLALLPLAADESRRRRVDL